jgi:hypothetical protein
MSSKRIFCLFKFSFRLRNNALVTKLSGPLSSALSATAPSIRGGTCDAAGREASVVAPAAVPLGRLIAESSMRTLRRRAEPLKHAQTLEMPVDAVDVGCELRNVAEDDWPRPRNVDPDLLDHVAGARAHDEDPVG